MNLSNDAYENKCFCKHNVCKYVYMYVSMDVCIYMCMYVWMYLCMSIDN